MIATSRKGIIDRSDIGSAGLMNKTPGKNCIYNSFLFLFSLMALYRLPIFLVYGLAAYFKSFEK